MKKLRITHKLFIITLCMFLLVIAIFLGAQSFFIEKYYLHEKERKVASNLDHFIEDYKKRGDDFTSFQNEKTQFYEQNNTWIAVLDENGNLKNESEYFIEIEMPVPSISPFPESGDEKSQVPSVFPLPESDNSGEMKNALPEPPPLEKPIEVELKSFKIPLNNILATEKKNPFVYSGSKRDFQANSIISISCINLEDTLIPLGIYNTDFRWQNSAVLRHMDVDQLKTLELNGKVKDFNFPETGDPIYENYNDLFMNRINQFQAQKLLERSGYPDLIGEQENIESGWKNKFFVKKILDDDSTEYIYAMTYLQPVNELIEMMVPYYWVLALILFILILLVSFYYSKLISKPLIRMQKITEKMAKFNFSEKIPVTTRDEIGSLSNSINSLSANLQERMSQLYLANEKLKKDIEKEKKLEKIRKEFVSNVSHELKTPLSVLKGCLAAVHSGVATHKKDLYYQAMDKEIDKMNTLIVDMLELAKMESGTYEMAQETFSLSILVKKIVHDLELSNDKKDLNVMMDLEDVDVLGEKKYIQQAIVNLVTNAILYSPCQGELSIVVQKEGQFVKFEVKNEGAIPFEHFDRIWDRFYRLDRSRNRKSGNTGLGLAIVKNILDLHGAQYGVRNTGDHVQFYFYLRKDESQLRSSINQ
ncbi:HAMP domain-containing sensor histidine kinase [Pseudalkalibacillus sp. R45]|uniref:HAMP domain-containing sensor histidine kinase n=1 Tax=Pseudalkalibacillus sp. R45 TaxID=3457433 RepID=UPI003FCD2577